MATPQRIALLLWFAEQAEEAARFCTSIFKNARINRILRYGSAGLDVHRRPAGSVMTVSFELEGRAFTALNGGPAFTFNEAVSFVANCDTQEETDSTTFSRANSHRRRSVRCRRCSA
jgi:predicted 3-demethylubiquinone-9 3-methyltransferase (glyoxalase superfamily)